MADTIGPWIGAHPSSSSRSTDPCCASRSPGGSPLAGLIALLALSFLQLLPLADYGRPIAGVVAGALGIGLVISIIPVLVIRWIDRREPEPWFMVVAAFLWGGVVAAALTSFVTGAVGGISTSGLGQLLAEPIVAETAKGLGLLAILLLLRDEFNGIRDGFVYGALIGLGYTWFSTAQAVGDTFARTGDANWVFEFVTRFPLLGFSGDTLFTAVLGTAVGVAIQQHDRMRAAVWIAGGYLLAIIAHVLWVWLSPFIISLVANAFGVTVSDRTSVLQDLAAQPAWIGLGRGSRRLHHHRSAVLRRRVSRPPLRRPAGAPDAAGPARRRARGHHHDRGARAAGEDRRSACAVTRAGSRNCRTNLRPARRGWPGTPSTSRMTATWRHTARSCARCARPTSITSTVVDRVHRPDDRLQRPKTTPRSSRRSGR